MKYIYDKHYIDGQWQSSQSTEFLSVINPANGTPVGKVVSGDCEDIDRAVLAARKAFVDFSTTSTKVRIEYLKEIMKIYEARLPDMAAAITAEMGAPAWLALQYQAPLGLGHLQTAIETLEAFEFNKQADGTKIIHEAIGVCALIAPWNWPQHQIMSKVAMAIAAGCTMVVKPSKSAPIDACILAEIIDQAKLPKGVFNLVNGRGSVLGAALAEHKDVDMVSFTGSQQAGIAVAQAAAPTIKRVVQELGGKSANIILDDADIETAIGSSIQTCFFNSGQNCIAPSRMLVSETRYDEAVEIAKAVASMITVGMPDAENTYMGPVANQSQYATTQKYIEKGKKEGAIVIAGGLGKPDGFEHGYFVKPTIFAEVKNSMTIAQEEIFGPLLVMIPYRDVDDAIKITNDTPFGLAGYVWGPEEQARSVGAKIKAGNIYINGATMNLNVPFGGYKQSGNGREFASWGLEEFLEVKAVIG